MGICASSSDDRELDGIDHKKGHADTVKPQPKKDSFTGVHSPATPKSSSRKNVDEKTPESLIPVLKAIPILSRLSERELDTLSQNLVVRTFPEGYKMIVEGEPINDFFILKEGQARVTKINPETKHSFEVAVLKKGDSFGETALQHKNDYSRGATISASNGPISVYMIEIKKFRDLFGQERLAVHMNKRTAVSAEAYNHEREHKYQSAIPANAIKKKTSEQKKAILTAIESNLLFQNMNTDQLMQVVNEMWLMDIETKTNVIKQGDMGDNFYVVESGFFEIFVTKEGKSIKVAARGPGSSFGELALLYNAPRAATVTATQPSKVWAVDRWTFRRILTQVSDQKLKEYEHFLQGVESFNVLLSHEVAKLAEALEENAYPDGADIIRQGEQGDTFYILKKGEVVCTINRNGEKHIVARYKEGDYFGERALVKNEERAATVSAVGPVIALSLNREAFSLLLGPMEDIFKLRVDGYSKGNFVLQSSSSSSSPAQASSSLSPSSLVTEDNFLRTDINLKDLEIKGTLGKGSFGHVQLVRDRRDGKTYALKTVSKAQIVQLGQQEHIMSEKRVMAQLDSPFLIRLYATFKDKNFLYFLLEPSLGGELFSVLRAKTFFDEPTARFYAAGVVLAFEYMHSKGIIYRDLKPENLLLDGRGYLKITDFGFAKKVGDQRTWTLCGTPDYLAPEVVSGQGHGKGVDWWTLGILIYEMLASYPPFYDEDPMKTYAKIMNGQIAFPMHFSKNAVDLIKRLLHPKSTKRLGVVQGGATLIKQHPWFMGFDWEAFQQRKLPAPIIMPVKHDEDLSNFEEYPEEENAYQEYVPDPKSPEWDKDF